MRIRNPNGKNVLLSMPHTFGKEQTVITATKEITIKNKTISVVNYGVHNAWNNSILNTNRIYIYSIWGWKR